MSVKFLATSLIAATMTLSAAADRAERTDRTGEALAWTVAAYASCDSREALQADFRDEVAKLKSDMVEILAALYILADADNVCGLMNTYANEMLILAETDIAIVDARLGYSEQPAAPAFEVAEPEGPGDTSKDASLILALGSNPPPPTDPDPDPSDYQE